MILATITHDVQSNTLEARWLEEVRDAEGQVTGYTPVKCRNYSAEQKEEFLVDVEGGEKYVVMADW